MSILIIYPHGNALNPFSGAETRIWNLNRSLTNRSFNVSILHSIDSIGFEDKILKKKCHVYYYKSLELFGLSDFYLTDFNPFFILKLFSIIRKQKFDIIQLEFPWGFLITKILSSKNTILIYDSHGIESEFIKIAAKNPNFPKTFKNIAIMYSKFYEKLVCKLANIIITLSEVDRNYYIKNYKVKRLKTIIIQTPSILPQQKMIIPESLKIESRKKLGLPLDKSIVIFHGGLPHPPNQEAFDLIKNFISSKINNPEIIFVLAGYNVEKFKEKNIISLGFVKDLKDLLYSADFAIVPIISGSGMRTKCIDYIITGLPFIITKKGIEGLDFITAGEDFLVYDSVDDNFINGINYLHQNEELRKMMSKNLLEKSKFYTQDKFEYRFFKLFKKIIEKK